MQGARRKCRASRPRRWRSRCGASSAFSANGAAPQSGARSARRVGLAQPKDRTLAYADVKSAKAEENVLRLLFTDQKLIHSVEEQLPAAWFSAPVLRKIYERVLELDRSGSLVDALAFEGQLETGEMSLLAGILEQGVPPRDPIARSCGST